MPSCDGEARIAGIALGQRAHAGDGRLPCRGGAVERLIVGQGDVAVGRMVAVELAVDAHGLVVLALARQFAGLAKLLALRSVLVMASILAMLGSLGLIRRRRSSASSALSVVADQFVVLGEAGESFSVIGVGEQNLLPELDGHVGPSARFKGAGFVRQDWRARHRRSWRRASFERDLPGAPAPGSPQRSNSLSKPRSPPSSALPFYVQFSPRTKPESAVEKPVANRARF